jgi:hypothetical protein
MYSFLLKEFVEFGFNPAESIIVDNISLLCSRGCCATNLFSLSLVFKLLVLTEEQSMCTSY